MSVWRATRAALPKAAAHISCPRRGNTLEFHIDHGAIHPPRQGGSRSIGQPPRHENIADFQRLRIFQHWSEVLDLMSGLVDVLKPAKEATLMVSSSDTKILHSWIPQTQEKGLFQNGIRYVMVIYQATRLLNNWPIRWTCSLTRIRHCTGGSTSSRGTRRRKHQRQDCSINATYW